jgi:hypothetical protein
MMYYPSCKHLSAAVSTLQFVVSFHLTAVPLVCAVCALAFRKLVTWENAQFSPGYSTYMNHSILPLRLNSTVFWAL